MKIDLLSILENNQELDKQQKELDAKKELKELVVAIIRGEDCFYTNSKELLTEIDVKAKTNSVGYYVPFSSYKKYKISLNKTNIKKIQKYIEKEGN
jgi:hypothetical protein